MQLRQALGLLTTFAFWVTAGLTILTICFYVFKDPFLRYVGCPWDVLVDHPLHAGDTIPIQAKRCSSALSPRTYTITRELISDTTHASIELPATTVTVLPGCSTTNSRLTIVPEGVSPGSYHVEGNAVITDNVWIKTLTWSTKSFVIN